MLDVYIVYDIGLGVEISGMVHAKQYLLSSFFIGANVEFELRLQHHNQSVLKVGFILVTFIISDGF